MSKTLIRRAFIVFVNDFHSTIAVVADYKAFCEFFLNDFKIISFICSHIRVYQVIQIKSYFY